MRTLRNVTPTPEQAVVVDDDSPGFWLIRGAAGSGKTTTSLLRLRFLVRYWRDRREDLGLPGPVRVLVLTFNRTLKGYIGELVGDQIQSGPDVDVTITTFGAWSQGLLARVVLEHGPRRARLSQLAGDRFGWSENFLSDEVDYVLGRWLPADRESYLSAERTGRGLPRLEAGVRRRLLDEVIAPYEQWKAERGVVDWNDLAVELAAERREQPYDVVVVDEAQDFSANQVRALVHHLSDEFVCTFVRDTTQRIYPNYFTWAEVGVSFGRAGERSRRLQRNYRNTAQIAAFARPLVEGLLPVEDATLPEFEHATGEGPRPWVIEGRYAHQLDWAMEYLRSEAVGADDTVVFLHPLGWFAELQKRLRREGMSWTSLTREAEWPRGSETIGLSTMHSAKGLEFDHVLILGYNAEVVRHGEDDHDALLESHRRLLAMALGRARKAAVVGYKPSDESRLISLLAPGTFTREVV